MESEKVKLREADSEGYQGRRGKDSVAREVLIQVYNIRLETLIRSVM